MQWRGWMRRLLDIDWTGRPQLYLLILIFLVTRMPLTDAGFGVDSDAWRIAMSAHDLWNHQVYQTSRFPGYPVPEFSYAPFIDLGWIATNTLTTVVSLVGVILFALVLNVLDTKNKGLMVLVLVFFPILWKNSIATMDYMWALTFILAAWYMVLRDRPVSAGVMMGLAIGCRLTTGALILPFVFLLWTRKRGLKDPIYFALVSGVVTLIVYTPLFIQYGTSFVRFYPGRATFLGMGYNLVMSVGLVPFVFIASVFAFSLRPLEQWIKGKDSLTLFLLLAMAVVLVLFFIAPYESEYLIPAIPFGILLFNKIGKTKHVVILLVLLIITSAVAIDPSLDEERKLRVRFEGVLVQDVQFRMRDMDIARAIARADVVNHSVVIVGSYLIIVRYLNSQSTLDGVMLTESVGEMVDQVRDVRYVYLLSLDHLQSYLSQGFTAYYIGGIEEYTMNTFGYSLQGQNCIFLRI